jgi:hypothetical protein
VKEDRMGTTELTEAATPDEREAAHERIQKLVWDDLRRVTVAIRTGGIRFLSRDAKLRIDLGRLASGGPALVIDEEEINGIALAMLADVVGQNLELELYDGRLNIFSPSWEPDRIPF